MEVITWTDAKSRCLKRYFTGVACKRGHVSERITSTLTCVACKNERERREYRENPDKSRKRARDWQDRNRDRHNAKAVEYQKRRKAEDPLHAFRGQITIMVCNALTRRGYTKRSRTHEILGCSWQFFRQHIEAQFLPGMSWANRHLWHIDHIVALATAETEADVVALNHFTNLRPLWAPDNLAKSDKALFLL